MTPLDSSEKESQTILKYFKDIKEHNRREKGEQHGKKMEKNIETNKILNEIREIRKNQEKK